MKTIPLKILLVSAGIFILSGCYTQLSEPISRTEYFSEPDTVYEYQEYDLSDYNEGYRDGFRDFANQYLWYGYNPNSFLYYSYHPYWDSPWSYRHSAYLGYYDPFYYDPFWDWGYYGYYSPYSYYSYTGWYYSPYYYRHRYYHRHPYYYGVYFSGKKVSEGREQLTADRQPISGSGSAARANRTSVGNTSAYNNSVKLQTTSGGSTKSGTIGRANRTSVSNTSANDNSVNLQMTSGGSTNSGITNNPVPSTQSFPESTSKPNISIKEIQKIDKKPRKSSAETIPGFQNTLTRPSHPEVKPIRGSSKYQPSTETKRTIPSKRSSDSRRIYKPRTPAKSSTSEAKSVSRPSSRSGSSSKSSYSAPSRKSSNSSSSSSRSSVRSSSSRRSSGSSSKSSSSRSSSSRKSSSRSSSKKK